MSMKIDKMHIPKDLDRRIKIPKSEHVYIKQRWSNGEGIRALGRAYGVDKRLIQFILFPERQKVMYQARLDRGGSKQYYDKDKWRETMRKFRANKTKLLKENKLI